ncbi:hypothetical protein LWI29_030250 [Acer saccharum]|uniref:Uncharacterized protein n=1 Tax=Acer saccharum TaxID=4024 RepID=A0AA39RNT1_ACESA|nr:hypothetical protein LWI29_030250 [Acer saccharum]
MTINGLDSGIWSPLSLATDIPCPSQPAPPLTVHSPELPPCVDSNAYQQATADQPSLPLATAVSPPDFSTSSLAHAASAPSPTATAAMNSSGLIRPAPGLSSPTSSPPKSASPPCLVSLQQSMPPMIT